MSGTVEDLQRVLVGKGLFDRLMDYSCSTPSGTTVGKWWKSRVDYYDAGKGWLLCCYGLSDRPDQVLIHRRRLEWYPWIEDDEPQGVEGLPLLNKKVSFH